MSVYFIPRSLSAGAEPDGTAVQVWVSQANGDDSNSGLSPSEPVATLQSYIDRFPVPPKKGHIFHLDSGVHANFSFPKGWGEFEPIIVIGDGAGQPGDDGFTELLAPEASGAGSTEFLVQVSAGGGNAWLGATLEVVDGAAAGFRRSINEVSGNDLYVTRRLDGFLPGDTVRVVESAVDIAESAGGINVVTDIGTPPVDPVLNETGAPTAYMPINLKYLNPTGQANKHNRSMILAWGIDTDAPGVYSFVCPQSTLYVGQVPVTAAAFQASGGFSAILADFLAQAGPDVPQGGVFDLLSRWDGWGIRLVGSETLGTTTMSGYATGRSGGRWLSCGNVAIRGGGGQLQIDGDRGSILFILSSTSAWRNTRQIRIGGDGNFYSLVPCDLIIRNTGGTFINRTNGISVVIQASPAVIWGFAGTTDIVSNNNRSLVTYDGSRTIVRGAAVNVQGGTPGVNDMDVDDTGPFAFAAVAVAGSSVSNGTTYIQRSALP